MMNINQNYGYNDMIIRTNSINPIIYMQQIQKQKLEESMAKRIVLAGACRTAIGKMGGALSTVKAPDLGAIVIKEAIGRAGVAADQA